MTKIEWVGDKPIDFKSVETMLNTSMSTKQLTNNGPVKQRLEEFMRDKLQLDDEYDVTAVNSGTSALHALVSGINMFNGNELQYTCGSFGFPSVAQGPLSGTHLVDIDEAHSLNLAQIPDGTDGIIVTNLFGTVVDIAKYVQWATRNNKVLLFDNATTPFTFFNGKNCVNYGDGCCISLHHTKPIGYGEGGLVISRKKYKKCIDRCVNFGFSINNGIVDWHKYGSNYKISDINCAFILTYLTNELEVLRTKHVELYQHFTDSMCRCKFTTFATFSNTTPFTSCIPLIFNKPITNDHIVVLGLHGICARKYYKPLVHTPNAADLYEHILCLPLHVGLSKSDMENYVCILNDFVVE